MASTDLAGAPVRRPLTLGVEEEFLLLDPETGESLPVAEQVRQSLSGTAREQSRQEFRHSMIEMVTPVCTDLTQLRTQLVALRQAAAEAARAAGARLVAVGATPVREAHLSVPDEQRYHAMSRRFGPVAHDPAVCGCHVHVGVPDRELAVQVCNQLRPWLPVVQALTANSPLYDGRDTGHGSWRSLQLERWPSIGPTPHFESVADYDATVQELITAGIMLDAAMTYWYARPSTSYPTVEIRVGDVCPTVDDTVLVAALVRALVDAMIDRVRSGVPPPRIRSCLVAAAHWRAAHDGLDGDLVDLHHGGARPAWELVDDLLATVEPALTRHDDLDLVRGQVDRLRREGTGATRQRRIMAGADGDVRAVLSHLIAQTVAG
ncbi:carboxylate-amine ligase [Micromonospora endophytica]|uniref:Putative glutamate--cysteine ligase 2 n=1 Tax=Micromonospora endophytica TaxID=515350 RepID=A0A2W2DUH6_9ACTN|nr:glutamate--cysteine ligase [Micromonospora endophytica]PZG00797.1 carboxylate--amine ligase [Micromonospora endophytica]RIW42080.1 YbdK family carboxylate-amine ligase [Micromonospora endophytica]BCJ59655.1 putative glutamate--cysteine ligase 2 [Micromonospora endophytica]